MSRLIDANLLIDRLAMLKEKCKENHRYERAKGLNIAISEIFEMPTVDAVEVVRCKDCKYSLDGDINTYEGARYCTLTYDEINTYHAVWDNDFCADGKKER